MPKKDFALAILNYNGLKHLKSYLHKLVAFSVDRADIYLIDNASADDSVVFVKDNYPEVSIIVNDRNTGYAGGYNEGLKQIEYPYLLLVNSDIEPTENWINPIKHAFENHPKLAALQPKILALQNPTHFEYAGASGGFIDYLGYPFCRGRIFDFCEEDKGQYDSFAFCFWASGACMAVRKDAFDKAGAFDSFFFAHMEEIDLCWRLQRLGYSIGVEPKSVVYHLGGGTLAYNTPKKTFLNFRNNLIMMAKNLESPLWPVIIFIRLILDGVAGVQFLFKGQVSHILAIIKAHFAFYAHIPQVLKFRKSFPATQVLSKANIYSNSIVFQYFARSKKAFSQLKDFSV